MSILDNLPHTISIKRRTRTRGDTGGTVDTFTTVNASIACWHQPANSRETTQMQKRGIAVTDKFYFTEDPDVTARDTIVAEDSREFEVRSTQPDASAGLGIVFKVLAEYVSNTQ